jgi:hypothetical protein
MKKPTKNRAATPAVTSPKPREGELVAAMSVLGRLLKVSDSEAGWAEATVDDGETVLAQIPQHVDRAWLAAALAIGPVEGVLIYLRHDGRRRFALGSLFPGPEHAEVRADVTVRANRIVFDGTAIELDCGKAVVSLDAQGNILIRGRDVESRAAGTHAIRAAVFRMN